VKHSSFSFPVPNCVSREPADAAVLPCGSFSASVDPYVCVWEFKGSERLSRLNHFRPTLWRGERLLEPGPFVRVVWEIKDSFPSFFSAAMEYLHPPLFRSRIMNGSKSRFSLCGFFLAFPLFSRIGYSVSPALSIDRRADLFILCRFAFLVTTSKLF